MVTDIRTLLFLTIEISIIISSFCDLFCQLSPFLLPYRYDSVTKDGKLSWQDQLNEHNKTFFDICDGIFVNYTWKVVTYSFFLYLKLWSHSSICFTFHLNTLLDFIGRLSKAFGCCCWRAKVWCLHGYWCIWQRHLWWWTMDCMLIIYKPERYLVALF